MTPHRSGHWTLLALLLALGAAACGGGSDGEEASAPSAPLTNPVDPATAGSITGMIAFEGTAPERVPIRMRSDPNCEQLDSGALSETVIVGEGGGLANVFVYVKDGLGDLRFPVPSEPVVLDQKGCQYIPHVAGVQVGQPLVAMNSDPTLHNVHAVAKANREYNTGQPIQGMKHTHTFSAEEVMVFYKCDVHGWMNAYVGVLNHPFFAVTPETGSFEIAGLPPGTYTIEAWHETLGTQTQSVTIGASETADAAFTFKAM